MACGASAPPPTSSVPDTAADPLPYVPPIATDANASGQYSVRTTDDQPDGREVVRAFFRAMIDGDEQALRRVVTGNFGQVNQPGSAGTFFLRLSELREAPATPTSRYVRIDEARVTPAREHFRGAMPPGIQTNDRIVSVFLTDAGRTAWRTVTGQRSVELHFVYRSAVGRLVAYA